MLGENEAKKICNQVISLLGKDAGEVMLRIDDEYLTRFANNHIHQNVSERNTRLMVKAHLGKSIGMANTNRLDTKALEEVVARAKTSAKASPDNPNYPGLPRLGKYQLVQAFDEITASCSPQERAEAVGKVCAQAKEKDLKAFGALATGTNEIAVANTEGVFTYHIGTRTGFSTVVMETDGDASGWAQRTAWRFEDIPVAELGAFAIKKVEMGKNPQDIEPGEYPVVLDPYATNDLVMQLNMHGMGAQAVQEGRSWMVNRIGKKVFSPTVSIWDDGSDPNGVPMPFDYEGIPKQRVDIVKEGVVIGPVYDHATAQKDGKASTGHKLPPEGFISKLTPIASNLFMAPGESSVEDMIALTKRGIYITRFWYTRVVHPSDCVVTGMTRDGAFLIEDGKIASALKNLRFTQSYVDALAGVEALGKETHLLTASSGRIPVRVPALKLKSFNFTGQTV
jgi:predicted Zn-dependent protease